MLRFSVSLSYSQLSRFIITFSSYFHQSSLLFFLSPFLANFPHSFIVFAHSPPLTFSLSLCVSLVKPLSPNLSRSVPLLTLLSLFVWLPYQSFSLLVLPYLTLHTGLIYYRFNYWAFEISEGVYLERRNQCLLDQVVGLRFYTRPHDGWLENIMSWLNGAKILPARWVLLSPPIYTT